MLQKMVAHAQFCMSGDHTVEAMEKAIQRVAQSDESDQNIVVVVSDANFERYGILPQDIGTIMVRAVIMCVRLKLPQTPHTSRERMLGTCCSVRITRSLAIW